MNLILGGGLAGLSCSYHLGHSHCLILEKSGHAYGHIHSEIRDGFTWDEGPHVSFTKNEYVRELFAESVSGEFDEYEVRTGNYFRGHWIDHPAQTSLYQIPEPLRSRCLEDFLATRSKSEGALPPQNYEEWLEQAFGPVFAETFPAAYTRKYWTREPRDLTVDWVGGRIFQPNIDDVIAGSKGAIGLPTHYITKVRYPKKGGYESFAKRMGAEAQIRFGSEVCRIDLVEKRLWTLDGASFQWDRLINTLPLPVFLAACAEVPPIVAEAVHQLTCSSVLLVNVTAPHPTQRGENWMYVYDEDKYSTRINCTEKLTPGNAPAGNTGIQVEVYAGRNRPLDASPQVIANRVMTELQEMGLLLQGVAGVTYHTVWLTWANVIFDHNTASSLETIWNWLAQFGLQRDDQDLHPLTDWERCEPIQQSAKLVMAGRFGQWKYYWSDDCVLRGRQVAAGLLSSLRRL